MGLYLALDVGASIELCEKNIRQLKELVLERSPRFSLAFRAVQILLLLERCIKTLFKASFPPLLDQRAFEIDDVDPAGFLEHRLSVALLALPLILAPPRAIQRTGKPRLERVPQYGRVGTVAISASEDRERFPAQRATYLIGSSSS